MWVPNLFVLATHDIPINENVKIITYADDVTFLVRHKNYRRAAQIAQNHLSDLEEWLRNNRMKVAPQKSSVTLFTSDNLERQVKPDLYLNNHIPNSDNPTILGLTFDPTLTYTPHIENICNKVDKKINTIKSLAGTTFGQQKEDQIRLYRQYIRPSLNYASPAWSGQTSKTNIKKLQTKQNKALLKSCHRMHCVHPNWSSALGN